MEINSSTKKQDVDKRTQKARTLLANFLGKIEYCVSKFTTNISNCRISLWSIPRSTSKYSSNTLQNTLGFSVCQKASFFEQYNTSHSLFCTPSISLKLFSNQNIVILNFFRFWMLSNLLSPWISLYAKSHYCVLIHILRDTN